MNTPGQSPVPGGSVIESAEQVPGAPVLADVQDRPGSTEANPNTGDTVVTETSEPRLIDLAPGFSIPFELDAKHREEFQASGITDALIEAAGIFSAENHSIGIVLGHQPRNFAWGLGFVIPYRFANESSPPYQRVKLDFPRHNRKGEPIKYESPVNTSNRAYFPPGFFDTCASAPYILVTEGEKKALARMQMRIPTIGLVGVWGWQKRRERDEGGRAFGKRELIADLADIDWKGRNVIIVFDADCHIVWHI
jgi:hypothetical protein